MEQVLIALSSFLGGSLLTTVGFMWKFNERLTTFCTKLDEHLKQAQPVCQAHAKMAEDVAGLRATVKA